MCYFEISGKGSKKKANAQIFVSGSKQKLNLPLKKYKIKPKIDCLFPRFWLFYYNLFPFL
jgi:hypothetical protein